MSRLENAQLCSTSEIPARQMRLSWYWNFNSILNNDATKSKAKNNGPLMGLRNKLHHPFICVCILKLDVDVKLYITCAAVVVSSTLPPILLIGTASYMFYVQ